jgi:hypothetical protein
MQVVGPGQPADERQPHIQAHGPRVDLLAIIPPLAVALAASRIRQRFRLTRGSPLEWNKNGSNLLFPDSQRRPMPHNNINALTERPDVLTRPKLEGGRRFQLSTPFQPAGDQPTAIPN